MCGLNWVWVSGLFIGYGVGPNWAPSKQAQLAPTLDTVWMCGLNLAWVSGLFTVYEGGPNWALTKKPSWATRWILREYLAELRLDFWAVYGVRSVPQLGLYRKPSWPHIGYRVDTWAKLGLYVFLGCLPVRSGSQLGTNKKKQLGPTRDLV